MADIIFTLKIVVVLLIVCGLDLGLVAILLFSRNVTLPRRHNLLMLALLAFINVVLLIVGYVAFFARLH